MALAGEDGWRPTVLLVDDDVEQRDLYELALRDELHIIAASRGANALRIAHDTQPDAVVLDVVMPGLDGWDVCQQLKAGVATSSIPVIMLTGEPHDDGLERARRVGAAAILTKPCLPGLLLSTIFAALRDRDPSAGAIVRTPSKAPTPSQHAGRVLIVDDLAANRDHLTALLTHEGHVVCRPGTARRLWTSWCATHPIWYSST
jgi:CheY-like chemotaxis protein